MSVFHNNVLGGAAGQTGGAAAGEFTLEKSVRLNADDSAFLSRTFGSGGNRRTFTISCWVKRHNVDENNYLMAARDGTTYPNASIRAIRNSTFGFYYLDQTSGTNHILLQSHTTAVFRDPSAWYHFVIATDTTQSTESDRVKLYVNGVQVTLDGTFPSQNFDCTISKNIQHTIGRRTKNTGAYEYGDGYFADYHYIDGSALDATSFGAYDDNGVWQAAAYSGTYGTTGFHIFDFANESTVGHDSSGNENDFSTSNISTSAGAGNDVLFDVPTNGTQSDTGAGGEVSGNYCTLNPLASDATLLNGNLESDGGSSWKFGIGTIAFPKSGKWYFEVEATAYSGNFGIAKLLSSSQINATIRDSSESTAVWYAFDGKVWSRYSGQGSTTSVQTGLTTFNNGDVVGFGVNVDDEEVKFYVNGSLQYTYSLPTQIAADLTAGKLFPIVDTFGGVNAICNFGQRPFDYSAPSGYKALCTTNLPTPTIADGSAYFSTKLYTGNGGTLAVTGLEFSPDWVWYKRYSAVTSHFVYDQIRGTGATAELVPSATYAEGSVSDTDAARFGYLHSFDSNGFTVKAGTTNGVYANQSGGSYVSWNWDAGSSTASNTDGSVTSQVRVNQTAGFSIVSWTSSNSSNGTYDSIGHGLNATPGLVITKRRNTADSWYTAHGFDLTKFGELNKTDAFENAGTAWGNGITSSVIGMRIGNFVGANEAMIAYCFAPVANYSQFGVYEGNGNSDGPFVHTGFRPALIIIKRADTTENWYMIDTARDTFNLSGKSLQANTSNAEPTVGGSFSATMDILSNGFKLKDSGTGTNSSGGDYLYMAWAENPFQANGGLAR